MNPVEAARLLLASRRIGAVAVMVQGHGHVFLTGGSLRDRLLGLSSGDLDLVVEHDARGAAHSIAGRLGGTAFPLGQPPLVTWRVASRRLKVDLWELAGGVEEDILRRDFTVNALFWRLPRGPLIDLVGGLEDLAFGRIRTVRSANLRDDPLRVLRAVRLLATHPQLALTADCADQLAAASPWLSSVAKERVVDELRRILSAPRPGRALAFAGRLGLLGAFSTAWTDHERTAPAARLADDLAVLGAAGRGWLAAGVRAIAPAVLAFPAAGHDGAWNPDEGAAALRAFGFPAREASAVAVAAGVGSDMAELIASAPFEARVLALRCGERLPSCLAWSCAIALERGENVREDADRLMRWRRRFRRRRPFLNGDEIARLLSLPPDQRRATAVRELQYARARGEVRSRAAAVRWLRARHPR